jgi:hypothetical protein
MRCLRGKTPRGYLKRSQLTRSYESHVPLRIFPKPSCNVTPPHYRASGGSMRLQGDCELSPHRSLLLRKSFPRLAELSCRYGRLPRAHPGRRKAMRARYLFATLPKSSSHPPEHTIDFECFAIQRFRVIPPTRLLIKRSERFKGFGQR